MENLGMGALQEGEWESLCKLLTFDEPNFATIGDALITNNQHYLSLDQCSSNYGHFPSNMSSYETSHFDKVSHLAPQVNNDAILPTSFVTMDGANDSLLASIFAHDVIINEAIARNEDGLSCSQTGTSYDNHNSSHLESLVNVEISQRKRKYNTIEIDQEVEKKNVSLPIPKKKARASNYKSDQKNVMEKEMENLSGNQNEDEINGNGEISEDGTIGSLETGEVENSTSKGKKRACRGAATDPQSLYARRRRQRINERLRILQSLVPNGTKVDISTMLEEAVHYVKFLQLQIRLLSSDDLWMYAPIAYNGFDISLYRQYSPFQLP